MSLKDQNIEELFRSGLEDAELPVNDAMWNNISKGISQTTATTTATVSTAKVLTYIGLSGAACAVGVAATLFFTGNNENKVSENTNTTEEVIPSTEENLPTVEIITETPSEDKEIVNQIVQKEDIKIDPIISDDEKIKETKKVVTVTDSEKNIYKGSWVNDFLTPKQTPSLESTTPTDDEQNIATNTEKVPEISKSDEVVKPSITEEVEDEIIASIVAMPVGGYAPLEVSFAHHSEQGIASWDFGDGTTSTDNAVAHTFEKVGKYTVTLTVTNKDGKAFQDFRVIEVLANSALTKIPNVFTPNNDGTNDFFRVEGKNIASFSLAILNTKGEMIYQSDNINQEWDGKDKFGEDLSTGTYVVIISAKGIDGKKYEHSGTVTLKR